MKKTTASWLGVLSLVLAGFVWASFVAPVGYLPVDRAQADPPADQTYTGNKRCASCHFEQYMKWKKSPHSKAFEVLTAKYQADEKCLKCHTVGFGEETGYSLANASAALQAVGCENCHGPGSKQEEISQQFAKIKELSPEQDQAVRGSIWKVLPRNICIECHQMQAHKDSETPPDMRK